MKKALFILILAIIAVGVLCGVVATQEISTNIIRDRVRLEYLEAENKRLRRDLHIAIASAAAKQSKLELFEAQYGDGD